MSRSDRRYQTVFCSRLSGSIQSKKPSREADRTQRNVDPIRVDLNACRDRQHEFANIIGPEFRPCRHALLETNHQPFLGCSVGRVALEDIEHRRSITEPAMNAVRDKKARQQSWGRRT